MATQIMAVAPSASTSFAGLGTILVLGDSIAAASGATNASTAYPAQLGVALKSLGLGSTIVAAGISGNTTTDMLGRLGALLTANAPAIVTVQASINDARLDRSITSDQTADNIREMVSMIRRTGAEAYVISSAPIDPVWFNNATAYSLASAQKAVVTNARVKDLCTELGVVYVDMFTEMLGRTTMLMDGIHPWDAGHLVWARTIASAIAGQVLRSTRRTLFSDGFGRPDSATTLGAQWTANSGVWGIQSGAAYSVTATDGLVATADAGFPNVAVSAKASSAATAPLGVMARMSTDANNGYLADINSNNNMANIYKRVAGTYTLLASVAATPTATSEIMLVADGTHLMFYVDGSPVLALTDSTFTTGNRVGIRQAGTFSTRWDRFTVTA